jgi:hypothetical protein
MTLYRCECCDYDTVRRANYDKHIHSKKHFNSSKHLAEVSQKLDKVSQKLVESSTNTDDEFHITNGYNCIHCSKSYKHKYSLNKHVKYGCKKNNKEDLHETIRLMNMTIVQQSQEIESHKKTIEMKDRQIEQLITVCEVFTTKMKFQEIV